MENVPVLGFAAYSGNGKTTLIEKIIRNLKKKGLRLAVLKHDAHGINIDKEGKDSWRFTQAGAELSIVSSAQKTAYIEQRELTFQDVLQKVQDVDLILVEGYKRESMTQIGICRDATGKGFTDELNRFIAVVTDKKDLDADVPTFGFDEIEELTEFIMKNMQDFTHFNEQGRSRMVDVGEKNTTCRTAVAAARVMVNETTFALIRSGGMKKGDVLTVAQIAGIMGAKKTSDFIPMCHPIQINGIDLDLSLNEKRTSIEIQATVSCEGRTGVEMEALTAVSTAALTVYDMCKAVQKDIVIQDIRLLDKTGGIHGDYHRKEEE